MDDEGQLLQRFKDAYDEMWRLVSGEFALLAGLADSLARAAPRGSEEGRRLRALRDRARYRSKRIEKMLNSWQQENAREDQKERLRVIMGSLGEEEKQDDVH